MIAAVIHDTAWGGGAAECSSPCHGEGRGFESRSPRQEANTCKYSTFMVEYFYVTKTKLHNEEHNKVRRAA
jgi:hypothetical protein